MDSELYKKKNSFLDNLLDIIFLQKRVEFCVLILFLIGFTLRIISARNLGVSADDVNHAVRPIGIFESGKLVIFDQSTSLWYYVQGIFYNIFGVNVIVSRFASVLFGSFLIILVYLTTKKMFKSEKAGLISSLLVTFSPMLIKSTLPEMDVAASFFLLLSIYFLLKYFDNGANQNLILCSLFIGIGVMIKLYVVIFAFSIFILIMCNEIIKKSHIKNSVKRVLLFCFILLILITPTLAHNYLLYQDKGFMDLIFTNSLGIGVSNAKSYYEWNAGWQAYSDYNGFLFGNQRNFEPTPLPGFLIVLSFLFKGDPLLFLLGILGLFLLYKKNKIYFWGFIVIFLPAFIYLGPKIPMAKHFIWGLVLIVPVAGYFGDYLLNKIHFIRLRHLLLLIILFNLIFLGMPKDVVHSHFYGKSSFNQLVTFKETEILDNSLVVVDNRIYKGNMHWGLAETNYIDAVTFFEFLENPQSVQNAQNIDVYYVECVIDDCGWGTVNNQPEFNKTMEDVTAFFMNRSTYSQAFEGPNPETFYLPFMDEKRIDYKIYKSSMKINPAILGSVKQTHVWFLYPIGYDRTISPIFDDYSVTGFNKLINNFAWLVLYTELIISLLSVFYVFYIFVEENGNESINNNPHI